MDERSKRINDAIAQSGYSYPELSKITGVSKSSLQRYATGGTKKIPIDCVEAIAKATGTSAKYLMGWEENISEPSNARPLPPVYNCKYYHSVSAGIGTFADEDCDTYSYFFNSQTQADHCFAVDIEGDSMLPELRSGDVAIVDTEKELCNGDVVVFVDKSEDLGYIKQYHKTDNEIMFISYNSAYKPMIFPLSALNDRIKICGKVIKSLRDF